MSVTRHVALSMAEKQAFLTFHSSEAGETTDSIPYVWRVQLKLSQLVNPVVCAHFLEEQGKSLRLPLSKRRELLHAPVKTVKPMISKNKNKNKKQ
ncbi:hypothetical protein T11_11657 [Trichinella zimbabwensis]|uniref:Uncharacterized protein n=1 Tax=Trichinella zimbabwensis TaxID=268475 RepID=A0A0V1HS13_9BILA|nr:hypothetical protein T11_11657 [Trichinella zimbabwensis]